MFCWWFIATFCKNVLFMFYSHPLGDVKSHFSHNKKKIIMDIWSLGCLVIVSRLHQFAKQIKWMEIYECLLGLYNKWSLVTHFLTKRLNAPRVLPSIPHHTISASYLICYIFYTHHHVYLCSSGCQHVMSTAEERLRMRRTCQTFRLVKGGKAQLWPRAFPPLTSLNVCCCPQWMKERRTKTSAK